MTSIHSAALEGFSAEAAAYFRGRPGYSTALLPWLRDRLLLGPGRNVVDLGAGTGKFTGLLLRSGAKVIAVEPVEAMRAQLIGSLPQVDALAGTAEAIPLKTGSVHAVACAQSFHWFATQGALQEMHRILAPGGTLGLVWNARDESVDWVAAIGKIIEPYAGDSPRFHSGEWRRAFEGEMFSKPEQALFSYQHIGPAQDVIVNRFLSVSFIAALPAAEKARVAARLRALSDAVPRLEGRTEISFPYRTAAYSCVRQ